MIRSAAAIASTALRGASLTALNVSVDRLDTRQFQAITGQDKFHQVVMAGIDAAFAASFDFRQSEDQNIVLLREVNGIHLNTFLAWIKPRPLQLRFIELMENDESNALFRERHVSCELIRQRLEQRGWRCHSPAGARGRVRCWFSVMMIIEVKKDFCASCNSLRVSSVYKLHLYLFGDGGIPLRDLLESDWALGLRR